MDGEDFILRRPLDRPASRDDDLTHVPVCCLPLVAEIIVHLMSDIKLKTEQLDKATSVH